MTDEMRIRILLRRDMMKGHSTRRETQAPPQQEGAPQPPLFSGREGKRTLSLTRDFRGLVRDDSLLSVMGGRRSRRNYLREDLSLEETAFLLWMTQGVQESSARSSRFTLRTVPSAGARHALESYLLANRIRGLEPGIWHYLPEKHRLEFLGDPVDREGLAAEAFMGQVFASGSPAAFLWTAVPGRMEWRYADQAQKYILLDAGHVCQNLYLACGAIGCGACAIGAYLQEPADRLLGLEDRADLEDGAEFVVYAASVGKV